MGDCCNDVMYVLQGGLVDVQVVDGVYVYQYYVLGQGVFDDVVMQLFVVGRGELFGVVQVVDLWLCWVEYYCCYCYWFGQWVVVGFVDVGYKMFWFDYGYVVEQGQVGCGGVMVVYVWVWLCISSLLMVLVVCVEVLCCRCLCRCM